MFSPPVGSTLEEAPLEEPFLGETLGFLDALNSLSKVMAMAIMMVTLKQFPDTLTQ